MDRASSQRDKFPEAPVSCCVGLEFRTQDFKVTCGELAIMVLSRRARDFSWTLWRFVGLRTISANYFIYGLTPEYMEGA